MSYFALVAGEGYLVHEAELDDDIASKAEEWAAIRIDEGFFHWDRSTWTGAGIPADIAEIAELLGVGRYLTQAPGESLGADSGKAHPGVEYGARLIAEGKTRMSQVRRLGGPRAADGLTRIAPLRAQGYPRTEIWPT